jgi:hypothetical protein
MPESFTVADKFRHGLSDAELRKGMTAFRDFLYAMFDRITANQDKIDVKSSTKYNPYGTPGDKGTASVKEHLPVFNDLTIILLSLGFHGRLVTEPEKKLIIHGEDMNIVIDPITEKYKSLTRMSKERRLEMFNLLSDIGIRFDGADFSKEINFTKSRIFDVTHNENEYFPIGLKLIAEAMLNNKDYYKLENLFGSILRRGNFYPLANEKPKKVNINIREYANAQPPEIRKWLINADEFLINNGCKQIQGIAGGSPFTYVKRGKSVTYGMVCIIETGITGAYIIPGVNHLEHTKSIIDLLPDNLVSKLISGDGHEKCFRDKGNMGHARFSFMYKGKKYEGCRHAGLRCQFSGVKCRFSGYRFDLSEPRTRKLMTKWIENEIGLSIAGNI